MILLTINHKFIYELENVIRFFYPFEKIIAKDADDGAIDEKTVISEVALSDVGARLMVKVVIEQISESREDFVAAQTVNFDSECERVLAEMIFHILVKITGYTPSWGILTGVRPAKLMRRLAEKNGTAAEDIFREKYFVNPEKIELCRRVGGYEEKIISLSTERSFSLYLAIPFCPSRCSYCSFVSHSVEKSAALVPEYVELLCREMKDVANRAKMLGLKLETVYIGGGTPTTFSSQQLEQIMGTVAENFDLSSIREYTVEAGRPDTIAAAKLSAIKRGGATRISINPQTMNDSVLEAIGRRHTAAQTVEAFRLARECGFDNINMDLIAGLPLDTLDSFKQTLSKILELDPESVTIHTLAMKRSSRLTKNGERELLDAGAEVSKMLRYGQDRLCAAGIMPYYMYRQSKTVGNLENVGYAKPGFEGLYNVYIMDETHTILACGASAVSKLRVPGKDYIERIFNYKYPYEYNSRFDEILKRKEKINEFYEKYVRFDEQSE